MIGQAKQENWNGEFQFVKGDIRDRNLLKELFEKYTFDGIIHLAAMAGVRVSIDDPELYYDVNVNGTLALLDGAVGRLRPTTSQRHAPTFVFASTSSVYGDTKIIPLSLRIIVTDLSRLMPPVNGPANYWALPIIISINWILPAFDSSRYMGLGATGYDGI